MKRLLAIVLTGLCLTVMAGCASGPDPDIRKMEVIDDANSKK